MTNVVQRSFTGGEISPELYARTDQVKYATGLRTLRNFLVQRHGGAANRPGTGMVAETKNSAAIRPLKFVFNTDQTYLLEFGDRYMRVYQNGGQLVALGAAAWVTATVYAASALVSQGGVTYYCTADHTSGAATQPGVGASWASNWYALVTGPGGPIYEIPTPYLAADLATLQIKQSADVVTIVHQNYAQRELRRTGHTAWTLVPIVFAPSIGGVTNVAAAGGAGAAVTYWAITAIDGATGEEGLPVFFSAPAKVPAAGTPTVLTWDPASGAIGYNYYRSTDGQTYGFVGPAGGTQQAASDSTWTTTSSTSTAGFSGWAAAPDQARNPTIAAAANKAYDGNYTVQGKITITAAGGAPGVTESRVRAYYSRDGEPRVDAGVIFDGFDIFHAISRSTSFTATVFVPDNGYTALVLDFVAEVNGDDSASPGLCTFTCAIDTSTAPNNVVSWQKTGTGASDIGLAVDYQQQPPTMPALFKTPGSYPGAVGLYQQRRLFANSIDDPERVWGSRSGVFESFSTSTPLQDDDAVSFTLASDQVNAIRHLLDVGRLFLMTASSVVVLGESEGDVLTPTNINARQRMAIGVDTLPPLIVGNVVLFVEARGSIVRDLRTDVIKGYLSDDLTLFAAHLVDGYTLTSWDFARTPHSILWIVRSDGVLLGLTYLKEQEVWGWHRHDTDGAIENVCVLPEAGEDRVYLVVRRVINGVTKRYIERMQLRTVTALTDPRDLAFVDCGLSYDGRNTGPTTMTLTGGVQWDQGEQLTCTASAATFGAGDVGNAVPFFDASGTELFRGVIEVYTDPTHVTVRPNKLVPVGSRGVATAAWARAVDVLAGLDHLEGKAVSILGDGTVITTPYGTDPATVVTAGVVTLDAPYAVVHVGLPYLSDFETLDLDTAQGPSLKTTRQIVNKVTLMLEQSANPYAGIAPPSDDTVDALENLNLASIRDDTDDYGTQVLRTGSYDITTEGRYTDNGRVFVRMADPLPLTILAAMPQGVIPSPS